MGHGMIEIEIDRYGCKRCVFPDLSIVMEKKKKKNRRAKNHALFVCECVSIFAPVGLTKARASCIVKARLSSNQWNVSPKLKKKKRKKNIRKRNNYHRQAFLLINNIQKEGNIRVISR